MRKPLLTRDEKKAIPFVLPGVLVTAVLIVYPLFYILTMSFSENAIGQSGFAGFANYVRMFHNPQFSRAVGNTLTWTGYTVVIAFAAGFAMALMINAKGIRLKGLWRSLLFIAWIIPGVVKATAWKWLFTTDGGMVNYLLQSTGLISSSVPWLTSPLWAKTALIIVQIWATAPYVMLMMTAGLQQLPADLYESADLDGANGLQKILHITLPLLKDIGFICLLMLLVWAINEFALIWTMTTGGQNTTTLSLLIYNQFKVLNLNAASASAVMQLIVSMIFAVLYTRLVMREDQE